MDLKRLKTKQAIGPTSAVNILAPKGNPTGGGGGALNAKGPGYLQSRGGLFAALGQRGTGILAGPVQPAIKPKARVLKPKDTLVLPRKPIVTSTTTLAAAKKVDPPVLRKQEVEVIVIHSESVLDIDRDDKNPLLAAEYINDILDYQFKLENKSEVKEKYLDGTQLNGRMRAVLLDWLVQVHLQFNFKQETLYITINILDRFLQNDHNVMRQQLQLVGVAATFIAVKYEEVSLPCLQDFCGISDNAFTPRELLSMEERVLKILKFDLSAPIPPSFLRRCSKAVNADMLLHQMAKYITELAVLDYSACHFRPSLIAASALAFSLMLIKKKSLALLWNPTIQYYSRYKIADMKMCLRVLVNIVASTYEDNCKLQGVRKKFASEKQYRVSVMDCVKPANWKSFLVNEVNNL